MSYATPADVAAITGVTYTAPQIVQMQALLDDAAEFLQNEVIGYRVVFPQASVTVNLTVPVGDEKVVRLPSSPVISVTSVTSGAATITDFELREDGSLYRHYGWWDGDPLQPWNTPRDYARLTVTYVHGFATAPSDLKSWNRVLALQAYNTLTELGTFGPGTVASVAIDDYRKSWQATGGKSVVGFDMPERAMARMQARYGGGATVVRA